jgi:hypothetical protein
MDRCAHAACRGAQAVIAAEIVAVYPPRPLRREPWTVKVRCPFCSTRPRPRGLGWTASTWGFHGHAIGAAGAADFPRLGTRSADCGGGDYLLGPLPAEFRALVPERREGRAR